MEEVKEYGDVELVDCKVCGRKFNREVLKKHEPICVKNSNKKRKVFDSGKQRATGSDIPINKTIKPGQIPQVDNKTQKAINQTKQWRQKHEALVESLRAARMYNKAKSEGGPLPPPPPPTIDTSLVQCPHCQRRFNEDACKRHIPFCKEQQARMNAKGGPNKKPMYKAPLPKSRAQQPAQKSTSPPAISSSSKATQPSRTPANRNQRIPALSSGNNSNNNMSSQADERPAKSNATAQPRGVPSAGNTRPRPGVAVSNGTRQVPGVTKVTGIPRGSLSKPVTTTSSSAAKGPAAFCHECGSQFTITNARFCSECGIRRLTV